MNHRFSIRRGILFASILVSQASMGPAWIGNGFVSVGIQKPSCLVLTVMPNHAPEPFISTQSLELHHVKPCLTMQIQPELRIIPQKTRFVPLDLSTLQRKGLATASLVPDAVRDLEGMYQSLRKRHNGFRRCRPCFAPRSRAGARANVVWTEEIPVQAEANGFAVDVPELGFNFDVYTAAGTPAMRWVNAGNAATLEAMHNTLGRHIQAAIEAALGEPLHLCAACFVVVQGGVAEDAARAHADWAAADIPRDAAVFTCLAPLRPFPHHIGGLQWWPHDANPVPSPAIPAVSSAGEATTTVVPLTSSSAPAAVPAAAATTTPDASPAVAASTTVASPISSAVPPEDSAVGAGRQARIHKYRLGEAVVFDGKLLHRTEPFQDPDFERVLASFSFVAVSETARPHWPYIVQVLNEQTPHFYSLPSGPSGIPRKKWRPFEAARQHVRGLGLHGYADYWRWSRCPASRRPKDIPIHPEREYAGAGWAGWRDWLGPYGGRGSSNVEEISTFAGSMER